MQTFATPAQITAVLAVPATRIEIVAADRADTTVDVRPANAAKSRDVQAAGEITAVYADGVLRIAAPEAKNRALGSSGSVEITVALPAGSGVEVTGAAGEVTGSGPLGDVVVESALGPVSLAEAASARIGLQDGAVTIGRLTKGGELSTQRGDLTVSEATAGRLALSTQKGDITVAAAGSATLDATTAFGRVNNSLKNDGTPALTVTATTSYGDITARAV
ncbi:MULTISPECIES: DUF4097 family beta strand repeat-containing protein [unclassified Streptomyces]|uniref:DUF4097 family beta strand repeat-containing protein n=1 Tax=unclassified Streptomyces TaxID=2593676 RepID=UPI000DBA6CB2|nr:MULTISPECIES: DUF4097 family beta strand repeat-containing protein [unclassified Streptomyces]MYT72566.1 DUF4097 family beta strand repeat protein [Streptomyces sp. SID8367]RAJ79423.1 putative adhesin [Streptomyces sp. PsTaAH-137]